MSRLRLLLVVLHRWLGLGIALFLLIAGVTGAIIAFDRELDAWLNPDVYLADSRHDRSAREMTAVALADLVERREPRVSVTFLPLSWKPGHTLLLYVGARPDRAGRVRELEFDQMFVDPVTGRVQGRRMRGDWPTRRLDVLPFIYRLHYSMQIPGEWGEWFMGIVAMAWTLDCFIALAISFPRRKTWRQSLAFRFREGRARLTFDLHRSGGVWAWLFLVPFAVSSIWMNLAKDVVEPIVEAITPLRKTPRQLRARAAEPIVPAFGRAEMVARAAVEARRVGISDPPGSVSYASRLGLYTIGFFDAAAEPSGHGVWGWPPGWIYMDGRTGALAGHDLPGTGSKGDLFVDLQFGLHSGRLLGLGGRTFIAVFGVFVSILSLTGIVIWAKKRGGFWRLRRGRS